MIATAPAEEIAQSPMAKILLSRSVSPLRNRTTTVTMANATQIKTASKVYRSLRHLQPQLYKPADGFRIGDRIALSPAGVSLASVCCFSPRISMQPS
jgi:hypothetical protein